MIAVSRRIIVIGAFVAIAGVLAVLAYGRTSRPGEPAVRGPFLGSYAATLSQDQAAVRGDPRLAGRFTLLLSEDGTYANSNALDGRSNGQLEALSGHRLRFYGDAGCEDGGFERAQGGIYRWSLNGERLTLRLVSEGACTGRSDTLTFPVWVRR